MTLPEPFRIDGDHIRVDLGCGSALFTTRRGGVSTGPYESLNLGFMTDDEPAAVRENRRRAAALAGVPDGCLQQGFQVHGSDVRALREPPTAGQERNEADGQATSARGAAPIVLVADCLPVVLCAPEAVAALHCGWRGLAAGIVDEGVRALAGLGARGAVTAAIGPGAGPCCYEVGPEVPAAFGALGEEASTGRMLDLKLIARQLLERAGVTEIHDVGLCTICSRELPFFSHRRDGGVTGRQAGIVWRS